MIAPLFRSLAAVALVVVAMTACEDETADRASANQGGGGGGGFVQVATAFAKALDAGDYDAAYALTSSHLRGRMTPQQFAEFHSAARTEYGKPLKHRVEMSNDDRDELREDDYDDTGIPADERLAWVNVMWMVELDENGDVHRCYETWLMMVKEEGQNKVGSNEYTWCD